MALDSSTRRPVQVDPNQVAKPNRDPLTGEPGAHPVGVGVGTGTGAITGAAVGALGGPIGAVVGAIAGGVAGGYVGKAAAEEVNPTAEIEYWRKTSTTRPYAANRTFNDLEPAYRSAVDVYASRPAAIPFEHVEPAVRSNYEQRPLTNRLDWSTAREASRDAWNRVAKQNENSATDSEKSAADRVNDVLQMLNDSIEGFTAAAEKLESPTYNAACRRYADERRRLADELRPLIAESGRTPTDSTEVRGMLNRAWMSVRSALGGGDVAIIESIEAAEDHAVETYRRAFASDQLTPGFSDVLYRQFPAIKASHDQFSAWKHQNAAN